MAVQRATIDRLLRTKVDGADPLTWAWIDNNSFVLSVGGVATAGAYAYSVVPEDKAYPPIPVSFTRVAEANPAIGDGIVAETNTLLAVLADGDDPQTVLSTYLQSATNAAGLVTVLVQPAAPRFTVTRTAPAPGTLDIDLESTGAGVSETFPVTTFTTGFDADLRSRTDIEVLVTPVDINGVPLNPIAVTCDITVRRMVDRGDGTPVGVSSAQTDTGVLLGDSVRVKGGGGRIGVTTSAVSAPVATMDHLEIWIREATG